MVNKVSLGEHYKLGFWCSTPLSTIYRFSIQLYRGGNDKLDI